jgi:hypothetical protein
MRPEAEASGYLIVAGWKRTTARTGESRFFPFGFAQGQMKARKATASATTKTTAMTKAKAECRDLSTARHDEAMTLRSR